MENLTFNLEKLLNVVIPDPEDCRREAQELRLRDPDSSVELVARRAVKDSRKWAASIGAATGLAANPITLLPAAIADAAAMLRLEGKLVGTIAALLDPESLNEPEIFRREIIRNVFPGAISQALRKLGVRASEQATKNLVRKVLSRESGKEIAERAAKLLGIRLTEKAIASKTVPIVGATIGAAWNWTEIQLVGNRAIDYHLGREPAGVRIRKRVRAFVRAQRKRLPDM